MGSIEPTPGRSTENKKTQAHTLYLPSLKHLNTAEQSSLSFFTYIIIIITIKLINYIILCVNCVLLSYNFSLENLNMENIVEPDESFEFSNLSLANPVGIQGGAYFTKILNNNSPLYIQTTRCVTRQGIIKSGKKHYADFMFDNNSASLINWFENLESRCQQLILGKSSEWFQNALDVSDVENAFNSTIRIYKSGKFYLVRANVKNNALNEPSIKIYNENEIPLAMSDITSDKNLISILEIQGIKFTSRNFQIEIEIKQIMVLNNDLLFNNCLIKTDNTRRLSGKIKDTPMDEIINCITATTTLREDDNTLEDDDEVKTTVIDTEPLLTSTENTEENADAITLNDENKNENEHETNEEVVLTSDVSSKDLDVSLELVVPVSEPDLELTEVDFSCTLEDTIEEIKLKKPNQVYFELYKEAKKKAKLAKRSAIIAYLEAKNIKKTYMIENVNDSDSDFDAEIDEVSESELESF